ncbi:MAG: primosomal protein N', partial [Candidatus Hydrogenedentota bacterium]
PVDTLFTYAVPASLAARAAPGMRALVPIQRRIETGYVVRLRDDCPVENAKSIIDFPDTSPTFSPAMLDLCAWIAEYYCCSLGEALQCAAPAGSHTRSTSVYTLALDALGGGRYTDKQRAIIAALHKHGPLTERQLAKAAGATALSNTLQSLVRRGILIAELRAAESGVSIRTETWAVLIEDRVPATADIAALQRRAPKQAAVYLALLHGETERPATSLYDTHGADAAVLRALETKGLIRREEREIYRSPSGAASGASTPHALNDEQRFALDAIDSAVDAGRYETFLLHGITGSGKTEVYLQAIQHVLDLGRDAIVLVPEISLTPQTVGRFKARFDARIAVLHSGLSQGERFDEWRRASRGEVNIVVGARSAVFAPLPNLGMIIVDEEHDTSYKQTETPRYHARDVAIMRAQNAQAVCVLGSATPSIEAYHNSQRDKSTRLELMKRATNAGLPEVQIVDMRIETREVGGEAVLSRVLEAAVRERIARSEQVVLLLNRRGHSPFVLCPQCG